MKSVAYFVLLSILAVSSALASIEVSRSFALETSDSQFEAFLSSPQGYAKRAFEACPGGISCPSSGQQCCCATVNGETQCIVNQQSQFVCFDPQEWQCCPYVNGKSALQACNRSQQFKCAADANSTTGQTCVPGQSSQLTVNPRVITEAIITETSTSTITLTNGPTAVTITGVTLVNNSAVYKIVGTPTTVAASATATFQVTFSPTVIGVFGDAVSVAVQGEQPLIILLRGIGKVGTGGTKEPSLQWIFDNQQIPLNTADDKPSDNLYYSNFDTAKSFPRGDEVIVPGFVAADTTKPVTLEVICAYGPTTVNPTASFGWYEVGTAFTTTKVLEVPVTTPSNGQTQYPNVNGSLEFTPGTKTFGFWSNWPFFGSRIIFQEDSLNTFTKALPHHVRVFPYRNADGTPVANAYVIATEETTDNIDYQDLVVIARNLAATQQQSDTNTPNSTSEPIDTSVTDTTGQVPFTMNPNTTTNVPSTTKQPTGVTDDQDNSNSIVLVPLCLLNVLLIVLAL